MSLHLHSESGVLRIDDTAFTTPADIQEYARVQALTHAQHIELALALCTEAIAVQDRAREQAEERTDPFILYYYNYLAQAIPATLDPTTSAAITAAVTRTDRTRRAVTALRKILQTLQWDTTLPNAYVSTALAARSHRTADTFRAFLTGIQPFAGDTTADMTSQQFVTRELTRYIVWRLTNRPKYGSTQPSLQPQDLTVLSFRIRQLAIPSYARNLPPFKEAELVRFTDATTSRHPSHHPLPSFSIPGDAVTPAQLAEATHAAAAILRPTRAGSTSRLALDATGALYISDTRSMTLPAHVLLTECSTTTPPPPQLPSVPATVTLRSPSLSSARSDMSDNSEHGDDIVLDTPLPLHQLSQSTKRPASPDTSTNLMPQSKRRSRSLVRAGGNSTGSLFCQRESSPPSPTTPGSNRVCYCHNLPQPPPASILATILTLPSCQNTNSPGIQSAARNEAIRVAASLTGYTLCRNHAWKFASAIGLQKNNLSQAAFDSYIARYSQVDDEWFLSNEASVAILREFRPPHRIDSSGLAKHPLPLPPSSDPWTPTFMLPQLRARALLDEIFPHLASSWDRDGDIVTDIFGWLLTDPELAPLFADEWDMYSFHFQSKPGEGRKGWLRNMVFSVSQQCVRCNLTFYLLHVLLHPDHPLQWISYPYGTKYALPGMETAFMHLDLNVWKAMAAMSSGTTASYPIATLIQSAVSFDNEEPTSCTKIVTGLHQPANFLVWGRDQPHTSAQIQAKVLFNSERNASLGLNLRFRKDVARAGEVRMSNPHNLHGSTGPATSNRRVVFAWLVPHDGTALFQDKIGTVADVARAHREQIFLPQLSSPSGYANKAGVPTERFYPTVQLEVESALADALLGRTDFRDPTVRAELRILLGDDPAARRELLTANARNLRESTQRALRRTLRRERDLYHATSFATNKDVFRASGHVFANNQPHEWDRIRATLYAVKKAKAQARTSGPVRTGPADGGSVEGAESTNDDSGGDEERDPDEMPVEVQDAVLGLLPDSEKRHPRDAYRYPL